MAEEKLVTPGPTPLPDGGTFQYENIPESLLEDKDLLRRIAELSMEQGQMTVNVNDFMSDPILATAARSGLDMPKAAGGGGESRRMTPEERLIAAREAAQSEDAQSEQEEPKTDTRGVLAAIGRGAAPSITGKAAGMLLQQVLTGLGATSAAAPAAVSAAVPLLPIMGAATMALGEPVTWVLNKVFGTDYESPAQGLSRLLTSMGVAEPDSKAEMMVENGVRTGADLLTVFGPMAQAGSATLATGRSPLAQPGMAETTLTQFSRAATGPAVAGEVAEEFGADAGGRGGRQVLTRGAEALGMGERGQQLAGDIGEGVGQVAGGAVAGGLVEGPLEGFRRMNDITSLKNMRRRTPESATEQTPLTRSEINEGDFMSTQRGGRFQRFSENLAGGTGEIRFRRNWENVQEAGRLLSDYGVEVDDLGRLPDYSKKLLTDFLEVRKDQLVEYTQLRNGVEDLMLTVDEPVPVDRAVRFLEQELAEVTRRDTDVAHQLSPILNNWAEAIKNKDFLTLNQTRRDLRQSLSADNMKPIRSEATQILDQTYRILTEEMGEFAGEHGGQTVQNQWRVANRRLAEIAGTLEDKAIEAIVEQGKLNPEQMTPELLVERLMSKRPSEVERLMNSLSEEGQTVARQAYFSELAKDADVGDISPTQLANNFRERAQSAGIILTEDQAKDLEGRIQFWKQTSRSEGIARGTGMPQGVPTGAAPGGGTMTALSFRHMHPAIGVGVSLVGLLGLGRASRYIEQSPQIKQMFRDLADLTPGSDSAMRLSRLISSRIADGVEEMAPEEETVSAESRVPTGGVSAESRALPTGPREAPTELVGRR